MGAHAPPAMRTSPTYGKLSPHTFCVFTQWLSAVLRAPPCRHGPSRWRDRVSDGSSDLRLNPGIHGVFLDGSPRGPAYMQVYGAGDKLGIVDLPLLSDLNEYEAAPGPRRRCLRQPSHRCTWAVVLVSGAMVSWCAVRQNGPSDAGLSRRAEEWNMTSARKDRPVCHREREPSSPKRSG